MYLTKRNCGEDVLQAMDRTIELTGKVFSKTMSRWKTVHFDDSSDRDSLFFEGTGTFKRTFPVSIGMKRQYIDLSDSEAAMPVAESAFAIDGALVTARLVSLMDVLLRQDVVDADGPTHAKNFTACCKALMTYDADTIITDMSARMATQTGGLDIERDFTSVVAVLDDSVQYTWGYGTHDSPHGWNVSNILVGIDMTHDDEEAVGALAGVLALATGAQRGVVVTT